MRIGGVGSHRRHPRESALGIGERHNALFYLESQLPIPAFTGCATKMRIPLVLANLESLNPSLRRMRAIARQSKVATAVIISERWAFNNFARLIRVVIGEVPKVLGN